MKYGIDDKPPPGALLLYGLQWLAVMLPVILITGLMLARLHFPEIPEQILYLRKVFVLIGLTTVLQVLYGHRLPVVEGPATILMVGIIATSAAGYDATYTALMLGGMAMAIAAATGVIAKIRFLFTTRVIAAILMLIAVTLAPAIIRISLSEPDGRAFRLCFLILLTLAMVVANGILKGVSKSLTVFLGLAGGSLVYFLFRGFPVVNAIPPDAALPLLLLEKFEFHAGAVLSFLFCYLGLGINQLGSVESIGHLLHADGMEKRLQNGQLIEGILNAGSGAMGVLGPVSFSLSSGIVAATGCASRFTLLPAAVALVLCGAFPGIALLLSYIPGVVMSSMLLYLMSAQIASGLIPLVRDGAAKEFEGGLTVGLALMVGLVFSFLPEETAKDIPSLIRPIVCNGFIMGTVTVLLMEHVLVRPRR